MEQKLVKLKQGVTWRQYYEVQVRNSGKKRPSCGAERKVGSEHLMLSRRPGRCKICRGPLSIGDWIYWNPYTGKARHADSGWRE